MKTSKRKVNTADSERRKYLIWSVVIPLIIIFLFALWHYRIAIRYYTKTLFNTSSTVSDKERNKYDSRNVFLMDEHKDKIFGIDISHYQEKINWEEVKLINGLFPVDYVFIRATMGESDVDSKFAYNWSEVKRVNKLRGAYHYFRPNENSIKQADNFIKNVKLQYGDLPPVLDIEELPRDQSMENLKLGLKRWLDRIEAHYKIKPILYSGDSYFTDFLEKEFSDYPLWIANYNFWVENPKKHWDFWQFSEKGSVAGIKGFVDLNMYQYEMEDLEALCVPYN